MNKSLKMAFKKVASEVKNKQITRLIRLLNVCVDKHAHLIRSVGIDAVQAFEIAGILAGGGHIHAFGRGFIQVQNGLGEMIIFRDGDDPQAPSWCPEDGRKGL